MQKTFAIAFVGFVAQVRAFWRMECPGRVGLARMDPVVYPGQDSPHLHAIHGSSGFSETSTTSDLLAGECTSCRVTQDKSSYWFPAAYFQDASTHEFELVNQTGGMLAYYLLYGDVIPFPQNFRMVSGDTHRRNYTVGDPSKPDPEKSIWASLNQTSQDDLAQRAFGFNCLNYAKAPEATLFRHFMPDKAFLDANCLDGIRLEIVFPSCWKGGDAIDSEDHKSHMAFPDLVMTGNCPPGFDSRLPTLMFEIILDVAAFKGRAGQFVFANGDTTGFGMHGDYIMGWEEELLQDAIRTCTNDSGRIEDCPLFNVVDQSEATQCTLDKTPENLAKEQLYGPMAELPGHVQITYANGSSDAGKPKPSVGSFSAAIPTLPYRPGLIASRPGYPAPGEVFKGTTSAALVPSVGLFSTTQDTLASPTTVFDMHPAAMMPTTTSAPEEALSTETVSFFTTQYVTSGNRVSKILWEEEVVVVTEYDCCTTTTVTAVASASATTVQTPRFKPRGQSYGQK